MTTYRRKLARLHADGLPVGIAEDFLSHAVEINESEGWFTLTSESLAELRTKWLPRPVRLSYTPTADPFTREVVFARRRAARPILTPEQRQARQEAKAKQERVALPGAWERLRKGSVGLAKVALGIDRSSDALIEERKAVCEACEHLKANKCELCGCAYRKKILLASEVCPDGRW